MTSAQSNQLKYIYDNIYSIISGKQIIYLGEGINFDVTNHTGYDLFTIDNFIVEPQSGSLQIFNKAVATAGTGYSKANCAYSLSKSYNKSTGIFTVTSKLTSSYTLYMNPNQTGSPSVNLNAKVWLLK